MSMRISSLALVLALAACSPKATELPPGEQIACAVDGAAEFVLDCTAERDGSQVIVHHRDGGFRRFEIGDGRITPLDGADGAQVSALPDGIVEVKIGQDRYRLEVAKSRGPGRAQ